MKKIALFTLAACIMLSGCGNVTHIRVPQESVPDYLRIENGSVIWQKVYDGRLDQTNLFRNLSGAGYFLDIIETEGYVTCYLRPMNLEYTPLGYRHGLLPIYLSNGKMTAFVTIQIKEDRYRVTVERIIFNLDRQGDTSLEAMALKENNHSQFKDSFQEEGPMAILNYNLGLIFDSINKPRLTDEF